MKAIMKFVASLAFVASVALGGQAMAQEDKANLIYLDTNKGRVVIKARPDLAPNHVKQIKALVKKGHYDGLIFHRVISGFMAQTGGFTSKGVNREGFAKSGMKNIKAEFNIRPFERGVVGMARGESVDSANAQFFIMTGTASWLNRNYTAWGEVVSGMDVVDKINKGEPPAHPDNIVKMQMAEDAK